VGNRLAKTASAALLVVVVPAALVWSACVGEDSATGGAGIADGDRGGKCFPNDTCTGAALACIDHVCVLPGDGDGGVDGSRPGDSAADALGDGGADVGAEASICPAPPLHAAAGPQCFVGGTISKCDIGAGSPVCCTAPETCTDAPSCVTTNHPHVCESSAHCSGATPVCCISPVVQAFDPSGCPLPVPAAQFTQTKCQTSCSGLTQLCTDTDPCPSPLRCLAALVTLPGANALKVTLGVCVP